MSCLLCFSLHYSSSAAFRSAILSLYLRPLNFLSALITNICRQCFPSAIIFLFFVTFLLGFGLSFELPVFIFFLAKLGIVNPQMLSKNRKYAILVIFIAAAILTPSPDALSQILMAIPLMFLYEVSIFVTKFARKKKADSESKNEEQ